MLSMVMFDADGVLFESHESNIAYYNAIFARLGMGRLNAEETQAAVFMASSQVFELRAAGDRATIEEMHRVGAALDFQPFFSLLRPSLELKPFLSELRRRYRIGLATNRSATVFELVRYLGLGDTFDAIASAADPVPPKPAPDILRLCLRRAAVEPEQSVYVGDSPYDQRAAQACGMEFIGVGPRVVSVHHIDNLGELPAQLELLELP